MKPVARAGSSRRALLKAAASLLMLQGAGCATGARRLNNAMLEPQFSITGGRLITRMDISGTPVLGAIGAHVPLVFPVAVAASFNDVYIVDAGVSRLYRYDRSLDAMAVMPAGRIGPLTKLQTGPDGTIYVLDPFASEIRRYTRGGQPLPAMGPRISSSRYSSFVIDPLTGKAYAVDSAHLTIDEIQPLGQIALSVQQLDEAGPIATDGRGLFVATARCGCVVEWIRGRQGRRFGIGKLRQPKAVAVDGPNVFVLDGFDRTVVLAHEEGIETMAASALGLVSPEGMASAGGLIFIADGAGQRVTAFRAGARQPR